MPTTPGKEVSFFSVALTPPTANMAISLYSLYSLYGTPKKMKPVATVKSAHPMPRVKMTDDQKKERRRERRRIRKEMEHRGYESLRTRPPPPVKPTIPPMIMEELIRTAMEAKILWNCPICWEDKSPDVFKISGCGHKTCNACDYAYTARECHTCRQ
jgi:hypothetical protein